MIIEYFLFSSGPLYSVGMKFLQQTEVFIEALLQCLEIFYVSKESGNKTVRGKNPCVHMHAYVNAPTCP